MSTILCCISNYVVNQYNSIQHRAEQQIAQVKQQYPYAITWSNYDQEGASQTFYIFTKEKPSAQQVTDIKNGNQLNTNQNYVIVKTDDNDGNIINHYRNNNRSISPKVEKTSLDLFK